MKKYEMVLLFYFSSIAFAQVFCEASTMKIRQTVIILLLYAASLSAQNEWVLQPWMQVVGYSGQNLGSNVGFVGKVGDSTQITVSDVNGINMYRIKSPTDTAAHLVFPGNKCILGDFNGDGIEDLVVGGNPTKIYLGKSAGVYDTVPFFTKYQEPNGYGFGSRLAVGKINGDQYDDLLVTDAGYTDPDFRGKVYLFLGGTKMDTIPSFTSTGERTLAGLGWSIACGDLNNDGYDDIIVKGYDQSGHASNASFAYIEIFLGGDKIDTVAWKYIKGGDNSGRGVASFDVNGDGVKDLLWCNYSQRDSMQSVFVHFSHNGDIDTTPSIVLPNYSAYNVANAGDMNGDGYNDIVISDNGSDQAGNSYVFVYSGGPKMDNHFDAAVGLGGESDLGLSGTMASVGDINGDGCADLLIGAIDYQWGSSQGYFGIFLGSKNIPVTTVKEIKRTQPQNFELLQNYPNPFNPSTVISYQLSVISYVTLKVYDVLGKEITTLVNKEQTTGNYTVHFKGSKMPSGVYYYTLSATDAHGKRQTETKEMTLLK
jgi:FG-GAP-like repeat/Secretion system C-terminal sorting domain/FG-GAP repeat